MTNKSQEKPVMRCPSVWLIILSLIGWCFLTVTSDKNKDSRHDEDVHPKTRREINWDVPHINMETNWDINKDTYEDADWHPPTSLLETSSASSPGNPLLTHVGTAVVKNGTNQTASSLAPQCGEFNGQLTSNGKCRLTATLPPVGTSQKRCPDMFRCTDDISYWLLENQNRKKQLEELRVTMSGLQEELRNHGHRVKVLEVQCEENLTLSSSFDQRLRSLELRHAKFDRLLHVHTTLLYELQVQLHNLSVAAQGVSRNTGCTAAGASPPPPLSIQEIQPPGGQYLSFCPSDCASLFHNGVRRSGIYSVVMSPGTTVTVYCDMETEGGGWTVFQRRCDGSVSFNRGWSEYRDGFGDPRGEHWLGNQQLHLLSNQGHYSLRIEMQDWSHAHRHAQYDTFRTENEENQFRLHVSGFSGTLEDSFGWYHDQRGFSTPDTGNICAEISHSGWWFHQCFYANLNGVYYKGGHYSLKAQNLLGPDGIVWFSWKDSDFYSLKAVTMMMRPRNFRPSSLSP